MVKIATPISGLFKDKAAALSISAHSDCLEFRDHSLGSELKKQEIFHCDLQPIHVFSDKETGYLRHVKKNKPGLKLVTFHIASCCDRPRLKGGMFEPGGRRYTRQELLRTAGRNFRAIKRIFGSKTKIAVENNNFYPTGAYKYITDADFVSEMVRGNAIYFVFDIAHGVITSRNRGIDYRGYKRALPMDRAVQLHVSAPGSRHGIAYDAHRLPGDNEYGEVRELLAEYTGIEYVTVEYYKGAKDLVASLERMRRLL
ncbi:MAG: DUF692 family protein [Candidatus Omnitrophica bacterium]|nr:DUF692 family protein [Candidatus Omnitrophota bacterium]